MQIFRRCLLGLILCFPLVASAPCADASTGPDPVSIIKGMEAAYAGVHDYTANFLKKERVKGEVLSEENIYLKFRKPFMVYMKWLKGPREGREALYVEGRYGNKVVGHEGGLFGFVTLHMEPTGSTAMRGNRHPITDVGIGRLVDIVTKNAERGLKTGEARLSYIGEEEAYSRKAWRFKAEFPEKKEDPYYGAKIDIWVDESLGLPIKIAIYGWQGEFLEGYGYRDLKLNPGLKEEEFDKDYKGYGF